MEKEIKEEKTFDYTVEQFADLQLLRYVVHGFEDLSLEQKELVYYLSQAALEGRDILFDQNGKYNLLIRKMLETVYTEYQGDRTDVNFVNLETYLKRIWFSNGIHHHYASDKFVPGFTPEFLRDALNSVDALKLPLGKGETVEELCEEVFPVIFDPEMMPKRVNQADGEDLVLTSAANYYEGVTQKEAEDFYNNQKNPIRKIDEAGNWTERFEGCNESGEPNFIIRRDIEYAGGGNDREKIPVRGKVKKVQQRSYIAIAKGPQAVDKGEKKGQFFVYEFGENGRKIKEERFTEAGVCREKIQYEYDETGNLLKESHYTPAGVLTVNKNYGYDKEGRLKHCSILDDKGAIMQRDVYRYDIEGNMVQEAGYLTNGTKCSEFRYIYDSYGQQIERKVLLQPEGSDPVGSVRRGYNFQGRVVFEEYFSPDGTPQSQHTYRYNTKGELISGTECPEGQTEEVKYVYKFHNDDQGNWKIRIKYIDDVPVVYEEREYTYYN